MNTSGFLLAVLVAEGLMEEFILRCSVTVFVTGWLKGGEAGGPARVAITQTGFLDREKALCVTFLEKKEKL